MFLYLNFDGLFAHKEQRDIHKKGYLRESDPEFHEFAVKTEISDFFISGQEKPFGDLFTKITTKLSKEFLFSRNSAKREMPYLLRSRHEFCRDLVHFQSARGERPLSILK